MEFEDRLSVPSAEGIDLDLVLAGIGSRSLALLVDLLLQFVALFVFSLVAGSLGNVGVAVASIGIFLILLGYPVLFEAFNGGRTLGKMLLGIAVVATDGTPITFLQSVIRNVVRVVDSLPGAYTVGLISVLATRRNQRVGDLAASTLVIRRGRVAPHAPHAPHMLGAESGGLAAMPPELLAWDTSAVTAEEVAAIRAYLSRRHQIDTTARMEVAGALAQQVVPKVAGVPLDGGPDAILERIAYRKSFG